MGIVTWIGWFLRLIGFAEAAEGMLKAHEAKVKAREVSNAEASVDRLSDDDAAEQLRAKWERPD